MTGFLAGLVERGARDGAAELVRRRPSLFEAGSPEPGPAVGAAAALLPAVRLRDAAGDQDRQGGQADEVETIRVAGLTDPTTARPRPARRQGSRPSATPPRDAEPPWDEAGDGGHYDLEPDGPSVQHDLRGRLAARQAEPASPPGRIETITEVPAPDGSAAARPTSPQPAGPPAPPLQPAPSRRPPVAVALPAGEETGMPADRPEPPRSVALAAPREPGDVAPARPLVRRRSGPAGRQDGGSAGGMRPTEPAPAPAPPAIHVTIGRIEVRATPQRSPATAPASRPAGPKLSLDEYLRSRRGRAV